MGSEMCIRDRDPAVTYTYQVTAIDYEGNRSATASITFSTSGNGNTGDNSASSDTGSGGDTSASNPLSANGLRFAANLQHQVHSTTAADIFWERATDDGFVQGYEVIRNGESLGVRVRWVYSKTVWIPPSPTGTR